MTEAPLEKAFVTVNGKRMACAEMGQGDPILFLHGNPTSSYLWRNIVPYVSDLGRLIVPDLIGMGDSDKLDDVGTESYRFIEHRAYLDGLLKQVIGNTGNVTLVIHDWGSALGFDWANRHRDRVRGICYMEGIVRPVTWDEWPEPAKPIFQAFRSDAGEEMILEKNLFIEVVLPGSILRKLTEAERAEYRKPFADRGEGRRPTLTWPRQIPIDGEPSDVTAIVQSYADWMAENDLPKLFVNAEPGAILIGAPRAFCRGWKNQTEVTVAGSHFIQEDSPDEIGAALRNWMRTL
ncbi:haloalkane dehalogenase [Shimia sp. W99]